MVQLDRELNSRLRGNTIEGHHHPLRLIGQQLIRKRRLRRVIFSGGFFNRAIISGKHF